MNEERGSRSKRDGLSLSDYRLLYRGSDSILEWENVEHVPLRIEWDVGLTGEGHERVEEVGHGVAHYFPVIDARKAGIDTFHLLDSVSDCEVVCEALYDRQTKDLKESLQEQFDYNVTHPDVFVINAIVISPEHRGNGLGLAVLKRVIERFAPDSGLVAMAPAFWLPGFWLKENPDEEWSGQYDREEAQGQVEKLYHYFGRLGFRNIRNSEVLALCTSLKLPPMRELCPRLAD